MDAPRLASQDMNAIADFFAHRPIEFIFATDIVSVEAMAGKSPGVGRSEDKNEPQVNAVAGASNDPPVVLVDDRRTLLICPECFGQMEGTVTVLCQVCGDVMMRRVSEDEAEKLIDTRCQALELERQEEVRAAWQRSSSNEETNLVKKQSPTVASPAEPSPGASDDSTMQQGQSGQEMKKEKWYVHCTLYPLNDLVNGKLYPTYHRKNESSTWVRPDELPIEAANAQFGRALATWANDNRDIAATVLAREPVWSLDHDDIDRDAEAEQERDELLPSQ